MTRSIVTSTKTDHRDRMVVALVAALILILGTATPAGAKQTSVDKRIFSTYEAIDTRTRAHEAESARIHHRLEALSKEFEREMSVGESGEGLSAADKRQRSRERTARLTKLAAEYVNQAYKWVDSAAAVVSRNLTDLAKLADELRRTDDPAAGTSALQARIEGNIAKGRAMRTALAELGQWAKQDNSLIGKMSSLTRTMRSLDRRIGIDKARLRAMNTGASGASRGRLDAIDRAVDRLADLHVEVDQERQAILDARNDVKLLITLGRLEVTEEIAERAIPRTTGNNGSTVGVPGLSGIVEGLGRLMRQLLDDPDAAGDAIRTGHPGEPSTNDFRNF